MYDHRNRYRCTIIRGKAQSEIESLIPVYARIIVSNVGLNEENFKEEFNKQLFQHLSSPTPKTLDNHRTEIAGKLYGMYYFKGGQLAASPRTIKVLETEDLPAFFKSIIAYFQFPNGMNKIKTIKERIEAKIKIRPFHFLISLLKAAEVYNMQLTKREIAYYALDSLDVLQGIASEKEVLDSILSDRRASIERKVEYPGKEYSYEMQHISELLNMLELTNLISQRQVGHDKVIELNSFEQKFIDEIVSNNYSIIPFDVYGYGPDLDGVITDWQEWFCTDPSNIKIPETTSSTLLRQDTLPDVTHSSTPIDIGDEGEKIVFESEKARVGLFSTRLAQYKVLSQGKQRGLGYDIQSVWANLDYAVKAKKDKDAVFYIEVKSTKRMTKPEFKVNDKVVLTRTEWLAAEQHKDNYAIFRVYLTAEGIFIYKIFNPLAPEAQAFCAPINYNYEFKISGELESWETIN